MESLFFLVAAVLLIEGIPYFLFPGTVKGVLAYILTVENSTLRVFGFTLILLGVFSAFLGRI